MVTIYFHNCYPRTAEPNAQTAFYKLVGDLKDLMHDSPWDYRVIIDKNPSEYIIAGSISLKDMIMGLADRNMRQFTYGIFNKFPLEDFYDFDEVFPDALPEYKLGGENAINIYAASVSNYLTTSLPLDGYTTDTLRLANDDGNEHNAHNFHGQNRAVVAYFLPNEEATLSYFEQIQSLAEGKIRFSKGFESDFAQAGEVAQKLIFDAFKAAKNSGLLLPCRSDGDIIKKFEIENNKFVYELRALAGPGFRVIIDTHDNVLYVALFYSKAEANRRKEQKAMAKTGWHIINRMKDDATL